MKLAVLAAMLVAFLGLAIAAVVYARDRGADGSGVASWVSPVSAPVNPVLPTNPAPASTLAPVPPPTPSYTYVWDPNNPNQCFNPNDPQLPPNAPRCPSALHIPADPGGPVITCPSGMSLVYPDRKTPTCLLNKPAN